MFPAALPHPPHRRLLSRAFVFAAALCATILSGHGQTSVLIGTTTLAPSRDFNSPGAAEAFQATAASSGTLASLSVYVDSNSTATTLLAGVYSDSAGNPGTLLAAGSLDSPVSAAWNLVPLPATSITSGAKYWIAILGTG